MTRRRLGLLGRWLSARQPFRQGLRLQTRFTLVAAGAVAATARATSVVAFLAMRSVL